MKKEKNPIAVALGKLRWEGKVKDPEYFRELRRKGSIKRGEKIKDKKNPPSE